MFDRFLECVGYLTIIPRARIGYEMVDSQRDALSATLAITNSYPTSASGIIAYAIACKPIKTQELQYIMASF